MENKLLNLKDDIVFQELFGKQKNSAITQHLLSLILQKEIYNIDIDVNKRMLGNRKDSKIGRLDIRAKFNDGEECNIELQVSPHKYMEKRMLFYWASMYQNKVGKGEQYDKLKPTISILIADYKIKELEEIEKYHTIWNLREQEYYSKIITKDIEMHILEIPKIKNNEILKDELALWLKFIENPQNKEVNEKMSDNRFLDQAREELADLSDDPDFQYMVLSRTLFLMDQEVYKEQAMEEGREEGLRQGKEEGRKQGIKEGKKEGMEEGIKEGIKEEKINMAKKLLKLKMSIEQIVEITELTEEEIKKIRQ